MAVSSQAFSMKSAKATSRETLLMVIVVYFQLTKTYKFGRHEAEKENLWGWTTSHQNVFDANRNCKKAHAVKCLQ
jgi:hypothetical protein